MKQKIDKHNKYINDTYHILFSNETDKDKVLGLKELYENFISDQFLKPLEQKEIKLQDMCIDDAGIVYPERGDDLWKTLT